MTRLPPGLRRQLESARLQPADIALADWGWRHGGGQAGALAMALANHAVGLGHSCLPLVDTDGIAEAPEMQALAVELADGLADNPLVGEPDHTGRPLILDGTYLYLQRYHAYECRLAERVRTLLSAPPASVDTTPLTPDGPLFAHDGSSPDEIDWQAVAAFVAQRHRLAVVSGGPGTGKTYTVVRLMLRLIDAALANGESPPVFRLAAPTGKAATRMAASVEAGLVQLQASEAVRVHLPTTATTLHRLLRLPRTGTRPLHDRDHPLPADVVIIDEASMVDLPMMAKLADALAPNAKLVLLGDRYQLASVESGSVLADLAGAAGTNTFSDDQREAAGALLTGARVSNVSSTLSDHVVTLQASHRFRADSEIGQLAATINAGDADGAIALLESAEREIDACMAVDSHSLEVLVQEVADNCAALHEAVDRETALAALEGFRLLTGTRIGPVGSEAMNARIARTLAQRYRFDADQHWYHGRPILILHNEPRAGLYNGDVGIVWRTDDTQVRVCFRTENGLRQFHPSVLPAHETAYAMTVHKSQGSEFDRVFLLLPQAGSQILSRELLYTGVTRARLELRVRGEAEAWRAGIAQRIRRHSGLAARITAPA